MAYTLTPLGAHIGAEVTGVDLTRPLDAETLAALNQAFLDHVALVIRDQRFTPAAYLHAMRCFGEPMRQHYSQYNMPEYPDIGVISHRNGQQPASRWHTDHTNHERPPKATVLYGVAVPSQGGNTSIANMAAAYDALPDDTQRRLQGLYTVNGLDGHIEVRDDDAVRYGTWVRHPLVRTHPETGRKALYVHPTKCQYIEGMTPDASRALIDDLLETAIKPEFVYRHRWRVGDVLMFDNRCAVHKAHGDYDRQETRLLYRIILRGDRPF